MKLGGPGDGTFSSSVAYDSWLYHVSELLIHRIYVSVALGCLRVSIGVFYDPSIN